MFTGIIKEMGIVERIEEKAYGRELAIKCEKVILRLAIDDSIAIDGVCQTVVGIKKDCFIVQAVHATLKKTTLEDFVVGDIVNLELPMTLSDPLGGHLVQGHINGTAKLFAVDFQGENKNLIFEIPLDLCPYVIKEGAVTINGISLTVAEFEKKQMMVSIIPHTWNNTNLKNIKVGNKVNLEVDIIAKYVESFLLRDKEKNTGLQNGPI